MADRRRRQRHHSFGVSPDGEQEFKFHASVEKGDVVVNDVPDLAESYLPFGVAPPAKAQFDSPNTAMSRM